MMINEFFSQVGTGGAIAGIVVLIGAIGTALGGKDFTSGMWEFLKSLGSARQIAELKASSAELKAELKAQAIEVKNSSAQIITELRGQIADLKKEVEEARESDKEKDRRIMCLERDGRDKDKRMVELESDVRQLKTENASQRIELNYLRGKTGPQNPV